MTKQFDILVIGAGIAGASAAANLIDFASVAIVERENRPGYHTTGRSAALFSEIYGNAPIRALSRASRAFLFQPPDGFATAPLVSRRGTLYIARADQQDSLEGLAELPEVAALTHRVDPGHARELSPLLRADYVAAALYEPGAQDMDVNALHQGYLRRFQKNGGEIFLSGDVTGLKRQAGLWSVRVGEETLEAKIIVNAAGAWADEIARLAGASPVGLMPLRRTAILVEAPADMDLAESPLTVDIDEQFYFKPDAGLLLLSPADEHPSQPCDAQPDEMDVAMVVDRVEQATSLQVRRIRSKWAGLRSFVPDRTPVVGFDRACLDFFWLAGQGGYGIQTAPAMGRLASALVRDAQIPRDLVDFGFDVASVSPDRFRADAASNIGLAQNSQVDSNA